MSPRIKAKRQKRGAYSRSDCVFVGVWVPEGWVEAIDNAVRTQDSDRSKFLRSALADKIQQTAA